MGKGFTNAGETQRILSVRSIRINWVANLRQDESLTRYSEIINRPQARQRDVTMLKEYISRPDLGGGIPFSGNDLNPIGNGVYDNTSQDELTILNNRAGENDHFTRLLAGPVFHGVERILRHIKVSNSVSTDNLVQKLGLSKDNWR